MNLNISFLICTNENDKEPYIYFKKNDNQKYELPTFEMPDYEYDVDKFVNSKFKEITGVEAVNKYGFGWINLFISGTIVFNKKYSYVYICKIPNLIKIECFEKIKMSNLLATNLFEKDYINQVVKCFNSLYVR